MYMIAGQMFYVAHERLMYIPYVTIYTGWI